MVVSESLGDNRRAHLRVHPGDSSDIYLTVGFNGQVRHNVIDISEGGVCFLSKREIKAGENTLIKLIFPWLDDPIEVTIKPVRCTKISVADGDDEGGKPVTWGIGSRFVALTYGQEDNVFRQVRKMERMQISEADRVD